MAKVRCVVLDIDDTLYLERDYVRSGFHACSQCFDDPTLQDSFFQRAWAAFLAGRRGDIFNHVLESLSQPLSMVPQLVSTYRQHSPTIKLLEDAEDLLRRLYREIPMAVITDGPRESQHGKARSLGLQQWCEPIIVTAEFGHGYSKPHPRAFQQVEHVFRLGGQDCVYIADNPLKDFRAPHELGWRTVRVRREGGLHASLSSGPDVQQEVQALRELEV